MKRRHWIEISDEPWCPRGIRNAVTDYCRFVTELSGIYNAVAPLLIGALERTGGRLILDLGSGAVAPAPTAATQDGHGRDHLFERPQSGCSRVRAGAPP